MTRLRLVLIAWLAYELAGLVALVVGAHALTGISPIDLVRNMTIGAAFVMLPAWLISRHVRIRRRTSR